MCVCVFEKERETETGDRKSEVPKVSESLAPSSDGKAQKGGGPLFKTEQILAQQHKYLLSLFKAQTTATPCDW